MVISSSSEFFGNLMTPILTALLDDDGRSHIISVHCGPQAVYARLASSAGCSSLDDFLRVRNWNPTPNDFRGSVSVSPLRSNPSVNDDDMSRYSSGIRSERRAHLFFPAFTTACRSSRGRRSHFSSRLSPSCPCPDGSVPIPKHCRI